MQQDLIELLDAGSFSCSGLVMGRSADGRSSRLAWFPAQPAAARFVRASDGVAAADETGTVLSHLMRLFDGACVAGDGGVTDCARRTLLDGGTFEDGVRACAAAECSLAGFADDDGSLILARYTAESAEFWRWDAPDAGSALLLWAQEDTEPMKVAVSGTLDGWANALLDALDAEVYPLLCACDLSLETGEARWALPARTI